MNLNAMIDNILNDNYIRDLDSGNNPDDVGFIEDMRAEQEYYRGIMEGGVADREVKVW